MTGEFRRAETVFRKWITKDGSSGFPAVAGRYWLYISLACPWASRTYAVLKLKGLEHVMGVTMVKTRFAPTRPGVDKHSGWEFATVKDEQSHTAPDPNNPGVRFVRDLYEIADKEASAKGRYSVPILWDTESKKIVNNESSDIVLMLNSEFDHLAKNPSLDLYPAPLRSTIDEVNSWVYKDINNGVYRCGFASTQQAYNEGIQDLFAAMDKAESLLSKQRYLAGKTFTVADIRLFVTLIRFDEVYTVHFKCNKRLLREYANLFNYTKEIYQMPEITPTVDFFHIKDHYYGSHETINPLFIVPLGSLSWVNYLDKHDREEKFPVGKEERGTRNE